MNKFALFAIVLALSGICFPTFTEITDNVNLEWSDNQFQAVDMALGNIDSDSPPEAVVVGTAGPTGAEMGVVVFEVNKTGIRHETHKYTTVSSPYDSITPTSVVLCDVDGDGSKDIVVGGYKETPMHMFHGFVYTFDYTGAMTAQYEYTWSFPTKIEAVGATSGSGHCDVHAVGGYIVPGTAYEYTAILNTDSGTFDVYLDEGKTWYTDSRAYGVDFFQTGQIVTAGTAESGMLSTQYLTVTKNPGNHSTLFGSTTSDREGRTVKVDDVVDTSAEEIIVGADGSSIMYDYAYLYILDEDLNELDHVSITAPNASMFFYDAYLNDVETCDVDNDGMREIFTAMDFDTASDYGVLYGYNAIEIFATISLLQIAQYDTSAIGAGYDSSLVALECMNTDMDINEELVSVINLDGAGKKIIIALLENEPQVPVIDIISPAPGETVNKGFTPTINVTDDSSPADITAQFRFTSANMSGYLQPMNNTGYKFYKHVNVSTFADGAYVIHFKVTDGDGNVAEESVNFRVDNSVLTVSMVDPGEGSLVMPGRELVFTASQPLTSFVYSIDGGATNQTLTSPYIIDTSGWIEGPKIIDVWAESATNHFHGLFSIIIDGTSPAIILLSPPEGDITPGQEIAIKVMDYDISKLTIEIDGIPVDYTGSPMPVIIYTNGWEAGTENTVKVVAQDSAGNPVSTETFVFTVPESETPEENVTPPTSPEPDPEQQAQDMVAEAEQEIMDAQNAGKDTRIAQELLNEAKQKLSEGDYHTAILKAEAAKSAIGKTVPEQPEQPEQPPAEQVPPEQPAQPPVDYNLVIGALAVLAAVIIVYYFSRKKEPERPPEKAEPLEMSEATPEEPAELEIDEEEPEEKPKKKKSKKKRKKRKKKK